MKKLLVVAGPTAVGKSSLAVEIAQKFSGEVISADSRQVYHKLDIATGKITEREKKEVSHYLLDVAEPEESFNVKDFKQLADQRIDEIHKREQLPILCGGSGFYIQAVVDNLVLPDVPPNKKLREKLVKKSEADLFAELKEEDPRRAEEINPENKRRLIRALEIVDELGKVPELKKNERFETLQIGLDLPDKELKKNIIARTKERFERGLVGEAQALQKSGITTKRMRDLGLEYSHLADYLEKKIDKEKLFERIVQSDWQYARRQRTWFRRDDRIKWFNPNKERDLVFKEVKKFLK